MNVTKNAGFSLVEILVSIALIIIVLTGAGETFRNVSGIQKKLISLEKVDGISHEIQARLGEAETCRRTLSNVIAKYDTSNKAFFSAAHEITVVSSAADVPPLSKASVLNDPYFGDIGFHEISFKHERTLDDDGKLHIGTISVRLKPIKNIDVDQNFSFPVFVETDSSDKILSCYTESNGALSSGPVRDLCQLLRTPDLLGRETPYIYDPKTDTCVPDFTVEAAGPFYGTATSATCPPQALGYANCIARVDQDSCSTCGPAQRPPENPGEPPFTGYAVPFECGPANSGGTFGASCEWADGADGVCGVYCVVSK